MLPLAAGSKRLPKAIDEFVGSSSIPQGLRWKGNAQLPGNVSRISNLTGSRQLQVNIKAFAERTGVAIGDAAGEQLVHLALKSTLPLQIKRLLESGI